MRIAISVGLLFLLAAVGAYAFEGVIVPDAPAAGEVHFQPAGELSETKLVPAGTASVTVTLPAKFGP